MPFTHRGMPVGGNHRPTPRLAKLMSDWNSSAWFNVTPDITQDAINEYRNQRDAGVSNPSSPIGDHPRHKVTSSALQKAIAGRNDVHYDQSPWDDGSKRNYLFDMREDF